MSILDDVREGCRAAAEEASHVRIRRERLAEYAAALPEERLRPALDREHHFIGTPPETVAYFLTLDAINFGSGYFPFLRKLPGHSGYFTIATALKQRFEARGPFTASELASIQPDDCADTFHQALDGPIAELMALFADALNELGGHLLDRYRGQPTGLVEAASGSAERLVGLLSELSFFRDVQAYRGRSAPLYKRAQLAAADLSLALNGQGLGAFHDLDRLTIFADNLVPHVLRWDGLLEYGPDLAKRIDQENLIAAGSEEEIEIRACAVHTAELLVDHLNALGRPTTAMQLDYLLWNRGQRPEYKAHPRHRARSIFY